MRTVTISASIQSTQHPMRAIPAIHVYARMHVCVWACMCVCMYVTHAHVHVYTHIELLSECDMACVWDITEFALFRRDENNCGM